MSDESKFRTQHRIDEDLSLMLATISAIPDGIRLANFPSHRDSAECWCRPQVALKEGIVIINHKNLHDGDFDC
jgi:hypothetical protein